MAEIANPSEEALDIVDTDGVFRSGGVSGAWDLERRLAEMDREGVAAEIVFQGGPWAIPMFICYSNRRYEPDVVQAGVRAYHRWAVETFRGGLDRILMLAQPGPCIDMDVTLAEARFAAENGMWGSVMPGQTGRPDFPPLYDRYFDRFWSFYEDLGQPVFIHAGYGTLQGNWMDGMTRIIDQMKIIDQMNAAGRADLLDEIINHTKGYFSLDLKPRRALWQLMLGGVFDRHPNLKVGLCEVRGDWLPPTIAHLDQAYDQARAVLPARRRPSEYWNSNCIVGLSFMHKCEVELRHDIGVDTVAFGRDYPHTEGTWPNTADWLRDAFTGVPDDEIRKILGENAIRAFGLDRAHLAGIASRIGPAIRDVAGPDRTPVDPRALAVFDKRGGYLKPPENVDLGAVDVLLDRDVAELAQAS
jgi:predicted TIM-barrel fold metal-dependent hydrolase